MPPDVEHTSLKKNHIQRQFNRSSARYDQIASMQKTIANDLLMYSGASLQPENALDAGCGTGYGLAELTNAYPGATLTGLDLAPSMLTVAKKNHPNVQFKQGDIEQLPFKDQMFDLTWSSSAIQWCDTDQAITELVRVTQPGGQVLLSTFTRGTLDDWRALWLLAESKRFDSTSKIESAFRRAGVNDVSLITKTYTQTFSSFKSAVNSIRDLGAGNAEENRFRGLFGVEKYKAIKAKVDSIINTNGQLELPYFVTFVVAEKSEDQ